ncbi:hypothetical protein KBW81_07355 [Loktanella salsilacus]|uniref:hypothetical protein n=1 Tax=Loktanella salsilacus TaxID=195913 RepID=UPI0020B87609|nr:hypothetical protein [Loktanella salsilacus]UTH49560.1 hypothetical protein KBW81_07355 [Loktanella salsilacus]
MLKGLDALSRKLKEAQKVAADLDGDLASVNFDAADPVSIESAIQKLYSEIDAKCAGYERNDLVQQIAEDLKESGRTAILEKAAAARLDNGDSE